MNGQWSTTPFLTGWTSGIGRQISQLSVLSETFRPFYRASIHSLVVSRCHTRTTSDQHAGQPLTGLEIWPRKFARDTPYRSCRLPVSYLVSEKVAKVVASKRRNHTYMCPLLSPPIPPRLLIHLPSLPINSLRHRLTSSPDSPLQIISLILHSFRSSFQKLSSSQSIQPPTMAIVPGLLQSLDVAIKT